MTPRTDRPNENNAPLDQVFDVLSRGHRRLVLESLRRENPRTVAELASLPHGPDADGFEAREIQLRHVHLPRLDETGFADWDRETDTVAPGPNFDAVRPILRLLSSNQDGLPDTWP